jgi:MoxR-like ATPase
VKSDLTPEERMEEARKTLRAVSGNISRVMRGQEKTIRLLLAGFSAGGHILLEDYPGTGKTTLAKTLAKSIEAKFVRVQFTPDLLPGDILGVSIFDQGTKSFRFHEGPIFTQILLADEINRASPRTQSALLEAMAEGQVSIDGKRRPLEDLFFVIATQNPVESRGTYPLPEAQMDRFALQFDLGYISAENEVAMLTDQTTSHPLDNIIPCANTADVIRLKKAVNEVRMGEELKKYIVALVRTTRKAQGVLLGGSPRASLALMKTARALALYDGLDFVTPDHVREIAVAAVAHRMLMDPQSRFSGRTARTVVEEALDEVAVPV